MGARVDANAVRGPNGPIRGRMTVHDHLRQRPAREKKLVTDPHQIFRRLLLDWQSRPNTGMCKEIIIFDVHVFEALQERKMRGRKRRHKSRPRHFKLCISIKPRRPYSITEQGIKRPEITPRTIEGWVSEKIQHRLIVI